MNDTTLLSHLDKFARLLENAWIEERGRGRESARVVRLRDAIEYIHRAYHSIGGTVNIDTPTSRERVKKLLAEDLFLKQFGCTKEQLEFLKAQTCGNNYKLYLQWYEEACKTCRPVYGFTSEQLRQLINGLKLPV